MTPPKSDRRYPPRRAGTRQSKREGFSRTRVEANDLANVEENLAEEVIGVVGRRQQPFTENHVERLGAVCVFFPLSCHTPDLDSVSEVVLASKACCVS